MRVSRAGDFCGDEAGKRKGGRAAGCRKKEPPRACSDARRGRAVGAAKVQAECRRGAALFARRKEPNAADVAKAISENGKRCSVQAERGKRAGARGEWFWYGITSPLMRLQSRKASLIAAFGLALCGFCRGGVHLIFVEEGLSIFCRRVRTTRKGCRAGCGGDGFWRRSAEAGAGRYCCCCCCCCARRTRAALDLGNAAAGETGKDCLLFAGQSGVYCKGCVFFIMLPKDYVLIWWITDGKVRK